MTTRLSLSVNRDYCSDVERWHWCVIDTDTGQTRTDFAQGFETTKKAAQNAASVEFATMQREIRESYGRA